jgi:hypothetical protein
VADRERVLAQLRELEEEDARKGALFEELHTLLERVRTVQGTAFGVQVTQAELPANRKRAQEALHRAEEEAHAAQAALAEAEEGVRSVGKAGKRNAELFEIRARDRLSVAERRLAEAEAEVEAVERKGRLLDGLTVKLLADGSSLAASLRNRPRVAEGAGVEPAPTGLDGLLEWAEGARAALFVARGQVAAEREAVIRQANELGSAALAEPLGSVGVAVVTRRVESALE